MSAPELPPEALEDLCRFLGEYGWKAQFAVRVLYRRYGVEIAPLDAEFVYAVEMRRRAYE
jgi:hypothetical protein